jgi:exodeoxyribonuclease V alpha subunit
MISSVAMPKPKGALASYIASDKEFRGIGPALATRLSDAFGNDLYGALSRRDPRVVDLLGHSLAEATYAAFAFKAHEANLILWLEENKIIEAVGEKTAVQISRCWGEAGAKAIADNPYLLTAFLPWKTVEIIADTFGIPKDDHRRSVAAVEAALYAALEGNHTLLSENALKKETAKLLRETLPSDTNLIERAIENGAALRLGDGIQPYGAGIMEEFVASTIAKLSKSDPFQDFFVHSVDSIDLNDRISTFERKQPYKLTGPQKEAIHMSLRHRFMVLAGYAGSGKTTSLLGICEIAEGLGRELHLMALSGRAAQRISEATGRPAKTIAGFLQGLRSGNIDPAPGALIVIDEASMLDLPTMWQILKRIDNSSLLLAGDPAQLPPIGFGLILSALCENPDVPKVILDQVMRQKEETGIPSAAEEVRFGRAGSIPEYRGAMPGVTFMHCCQENALSVIKRIHSDLGGFNSDDLQIISPVKGGPAGIEKINRSLHEEIRTTDEALFPGRKDMGIGDPVMWNQNDWNRNLTNGALGRILDVDEGRAEVILNGEIHFLDRSDSEMLDLAHAITVHKAQGSQWRCVIVPVFQSRLMDRTLLYTALTRASEQVVLVGDSIALKSAIEQPPASLARSIGLDHRLQMHFQGLKRLT